MRIETSLRDSPGIAARGIYERFPGRPGGRIDAAALARVPYRRAVDAALVADLTDFLAAGLARLKRLGLGRLVVGLSGGADSVACAALAKRAVGADGVQGVTIDLGRPGERDRIERIVEASRLIDIPHEVIDGRQVREAMLAVGGSASPWRPINIDTRALQTLIFQFADDRDAGVVATSDRSERLLGRYTEYFYGQLAPVADCFKTEVLDLVELLEMDGAVAEKRPGCEDYWFDDEVLGAGYDVIDPLLHLLVDHGRTADEVACDFGIADRAWLHRLSARVADQPARVVEQRPGRTGTR